MKIMSIIGARPQMIKAAAVSRVLRTQHQEILVHTGQHYDKNMSDVFFEQLNIPKPDYHLAVGSGSHGLQTGSMMIEIEKLCMRERPDAVMVYGDTNSTLAGGITASKLLIPVVHVEAGLRSFNMSMPEEQNRILTDHISTLLFAPTRTAVTNLKRENITKGVYNTGDVMYDAVLHFQEMVPTDTLERLQVTTPYVLATIHRAENTDNPKNLKNIFDAFAAYGKKIVLPLHPRTQKFVKQYNIQMSRNVQVLSPVGYLDMLALEMCADKIATDSGGVQKEAYFLEKPCITMRSETEWVETVADRWNVIVGNSPEKICAAIEEFVPSGYRSDVFGNGTAAEKICTLLKSI